MLFLPNTTTPTVQHDCTTVPLNNFLYIVHPESFRSNAQNAIAFARRNHPLVDRNDEFVCVYLHSFASTVRNRPRARTCVRTCARTYIGKVWAWHYLR